MTADEQPSHPQVVLVESSDDQPVRLLFVAGLGRSGSTLLSLMLGQTPGFHAMGEVVHLWKRGLRENGPCACGQAFLSCPFWTAVGKEAFGGWNQVDVDAILAAQSAVERDRYLPLLLRPRLITRFAMDLASYTDTLGRLYRAVQVVSGATVLVDSGKHVASVFVLRHVSSVDLRLVHLVRDSRGVAHSWTKLKRRSIVGESEYMARWHPGQSAGRYLFYNALLHALKMAGQRQALIRYEDLVADPEPVLGRAVQLCDVGGRGFGFLDGRDAQLVENHQVGGNPMRFRTGRVSLVADETWRQDLPARYRRLVTLITWPLLVLYGYLRPGGRRASRRQVRTRGNS